MRIGVGIVSLLVALALVALLTRKSVDATRIGIAVAAAAVLLHLYVAPAPRRELPLIGLATLAGVGFESQACFRIRWRRLPRSGVAGSMVTC